MTPAQMAAIHAAAFTMPRPWSADEIASLLTSPHCFYVAAPQGFVMGRAVAGESELLTIAVDPAAQGRGIGGGLIDAFLIASRARLAVTAFLEVAENNVAAIHLYRAKGFVQTGQRPAYYRMSDGTPIAALNFSRRVQDEAAVF